MHNIDLTNTVDARNQLTDRKYLRFGETQGSPKIFSPVIQWRGTPRKPISAGAAIGEWRRQNVRTIMFTKQCGLFERNIPMRRIGREI